MWNRCTYPIDKSWHLYGERGVRVCLEWRSFAYFLHSMGERPSGKTLDRRDPNGHYTPENTRWATSREQARSRANNYKVEWQEETLCLRDWAERLAINHTTLHRRLRDYGWTVEQAFTTPTGKKRKK